jgi:hypothetical protein
VLTQVIEIFKNIWKQHVIMHKLLRLAFVISLVILSAGCLQTNAPTPESELSKEDIDASFYYHLINDTKERIDSNSEIEFNSDGQVTVHYANGSKAAVSKRSFIFKMDNRGEVYHLKSKRYERGGLPPSYEEVYVNSTTIYTKLGVLTNDQTWENNTRTEPRTEENPTVGLGGTPFSKMQREIGSVCFNSAFVFERISRIGPDSVSQHTAIVNRTPDEISNRNGHIYQLFLY